jgi:hypothetical protein
MTNIQYLHDFVDTTIYNLQQIRENGVKREMRFEINCADLEDFNYSDIRNSDKFKPIFDQLANATGPSLYWFEITCDSDTKQVIECLKRYKLSEKAKATPALRTKINYDSKVLYVGKVKGLFWGRLIQHLGFFKVNATQGLQLYYWTKNIPLKLNLNVLEFDYNMADIMPVIEYAFAKRLSPLIGKHK